jgi:hypothetical protein
MIEEALIQEQEARKKAEQEKVAAALGIAATAMLQQKLN